MSPGCWCPNCGPATSSSWTTCRATNVPLSATGSRQATLRFLPPYSPDFNPIEKAFSRLKAILRKAGERTVTGLWSLIGKLVDIFQPMECANYFSSCGYVPN
jgi:transposase